MADEIQAESPATESAAIETAVDAPANGSGTEVNSSTPDRSALEARVAESLKTIREIDEPVAEQPVEVKETATETAEETPSETAEEPKTEDNQAETQEQQPEAKKPTGPILPDAYRRSLKAYDWSDEEINAAFKANPLEFTVTAQRLHSNRNKETQQWAELGRQSRTTEPQPKTEPQANPYVDSKTGQFKPINTAEIAEKHGVSEELIADLVAPINAILAHQNSILPDLNNSIQAVQRSRTEQLTKQVDSFFSGPELKQFQEAYGKDSASLNEAQIETRNKVLEMADALVVGAARQGRKLTVNDALLMAHDHVSSGLKTVAIRKEIQKSVTTRNAGITLRPTAAGKGGGVSTGPAKSKSEMEARTKARMAAVFGG